MRNTKIFLGSILLILYVVLESIENPLLNGLGFLFLFVSFIIIILIRVSILKRIGIFILYLIIGTLGFLFGVINQGYGYNDQYYFSPQTEGYRRVIFDRNQGLELELKNDKYHIVIDSIVTLIHREKEEVYGRKKYYLLNNDNDTIELKEIKNIDNFNGTPSIIVKNKKYNEKYNINIHDFIILKEKTPKLLNQNKVNNKTNRLIEQVLNQ